MAVDPTIVREWLAKAEEDFKFALVNLREKKPFAAQICFHFHQAAEKCLKAYIVTHDLEFRKIHDLTLLLATCTLHEPAAACLQEACEYLNTFYVEARYPVHWPTHFTLDEAERAHQAAARIKVWVEERLRSFPSA